MPNWTPWIQARRPKMRGPSADQLVTSGFEPSAYRHDDQSAEFDDTGVGRAGSGRAHFLGGGPLSDLDRPTLFPASVLHRVYWSRGLDPRTGTRASQRSGPSRRRSARAPGHPPASWSDEPLSPAGAASSPGGCCTDTCARGSVRPGPIATVIAAAVAVSAAVLTPYGYLSYALIIAHQTTSDREASQ